MVSTECGVVLTLERQQTISKNKVHACIKEHRATNIIRAHRKYNNKLSKRCTQPKATIIVLTQHLQDNITPMSLCFNG